MNQHGIFSAQDFNIFLVEGLKNRMLEIQTNIQPAFREIGDHVEPFLSELLEEPVTIHIAKHARRTVNPPDETWVAFSTNKRGYKAHPHFQLGINKDHIFICFALIYECVKKPLFSKRLQQNLDTIWSRIPDHYYISEDHTKPDSKQKNELTVEDIHTLLQRLEKVKKEEFLCGLQMKQEEILSLTKSELLQKITYTFRTLHPLYLIAKEGD